MFFFVKALSLLPPALHSLGIMPNVWDTHAVSSLSCTFNLLRYEQNTLPHPGLLKVLLCILLLYNSTTPPISWRSSLSCCLNSPTSHLLLGFLQSGLGPHHPTGTLSGLPMTFPLSEWMDIFRTSSVVSNTVEHFLLLVPFPWLLWQQHPPSSIRPPLLLLFLSIWLLLLHLQPSVLGLWVYSSSGTWSLSGKKWMTPKSTVSARAFS